MREEYSNGDKATSSDLSSFMRPPGQKRKYPPPSQTGTATFILPRSDLKSKTSYSQWGSLDGKRVPLICIHGGPGATSAYMEALSLLTVEFSIPVITYDQIGCGESTRLRERKGDLDFWGIDLFDAELRNLIDALNIDQFDLLGHSWGGQLAAGFAAQKPQGLRKLIVANSTAFIAQRESIFKQQISSLPPPFGDAARKAEQDGDTDTNGYKAALEEWSRHYMCRLDPWPQEMLDCVAAMTEDDTVSSTLSGYLKEFDLRPDLTKITADAVPGGMLILNGEFDQAADEVIRPCFDLPTVQKKWVCLPLSGHMSMLDDIEEVVKLVG